MINGGWTCLVWGGVGCGARRGLYKSYKIFMQIVQLVCSNCTNKFKDLKVKISVDLTKKVKIFSYPQSYPHLTTLIHI